MSDGLRDVAIGRITSNQVVREVKEFKGRNRKQTVWNLGQLICVHVEVCYGLNKDEKNDEIFVD